MHIYAVCFDISDDKIRTRVGKRLLAVGRRMQYSVFEIAVKNHAELTVLSESLFDMIEESDSVIFYRLCKDCRSKSISADGEKVAHFPSVVII